MKLHTKVKISTNKRSLQNEYDLTTTITGSIYKKRMNQTTWWKLPQSKHDATKTNQLLSEKFGSSSFCNWNCSFRHCSCQINLQHFGIFRSLQSTNIILATRHITSRSVPGTFQRYWNHLTKSLKWSQFDRANPYISFRSVLQVPNWPSVLKNTVKN